MSDTKKLHFESKSTPINSCAKILQYCLRQYVSKKAQSMLKQGKRNGKREKIDSFRLKLLATDMKSIFKRHKVST